MPSIIIITGVHPISHPAEEKKKKKKKKKKGSSVVIVNKREFQQFTVTTFAAFVSRS